ncbi:B box and SPRY domain-containing protein [Megalops cyprinoides]|uniref:B box and SPRY domain-containing protein n=1 Tax=Megalops cyprinoides TaxID=118141 RepID=UPI001864BD08|nr:B box and SPRY domain-containing protein [Megalops cyprinoides]
MSSEPWNCELTAVSLRDSDSEPESEIWDNSSSHLGNGDSNTGILSVDSRLSPGGALLMNGSRVGDSKAEEHAGTKPASGGSPVSTTDIRSEDSGLCVDHESELDWYCSSEGKLICSHCAIVGSCQGHTVTPIARRAADVRNQLVDVCEKMQLQALRIERFISQTLAAKEHALQVEASGARERVVARVSRVREALEEEEQRLLEAVQREEERVQQCLLTQRAHWTQALAALTHTRTGLVHMLTDTQDTKLATSGEEISERVEEAEGVGEPRDTDQLSLDQTCSDSSLLLGLWASAVLLGPSGHTPAHLRFDERTVSPLLSLSPDQRTLTFLPKRARQSPPYDPARFDSWPNALCSPALSSGTHSWVLEVGGSAAFKVGVCYAGVVRKGAGNDSRLGYNAQSWVLSHYEGEFSFCHAGRHHPLPLLRRPARLGVLLDLPGQTLLFFDPDSGAVLHAVRHPFTEPLLPACAVADHSITLV